MKIKITIAFTLFCLMLSCQSSKDSISFETFSEQYSTIQKTFNEKAKKVKSKSEYQALAEKRDRQLESLLKMSGNVPSSPEREILTARICMQLKKLDRAQELIDPILNEKSAAGLSAKMTKVQILISQKHGIEALKLFQEIEPQLKRDTDFFSASLYFALKSKEIDVLEQYSAKLLEAKDLPEEYTVFKGRMYSSLSAAAYLRDDLPQAKTFMEKALQMATHPLEKHFFQARLSQLSLIGSEAPGISADTWINSPPLNQAGLRGKVIVIDFWAPWCEPCRENFPVLIDLYNAHRKSNLVIIGYTKLYGMYRDEIEDKKEVDKTVELALIKKFIRRKQIPYPIAISTEGQGFSSYFVAGIPVKILIDKAGKVSHIQMGAGKMPMFKEKILKALKK